MIAGRAKKRKRKPEAETCLVIHSTNLFFESGSHRCMTRHALAAPPSDTAASEREEEHESESLGKPDRSKGLVFCCRKGTLPKNLGLVAVEGAGNEPGLLSCFAPRRTAARVSCWEGRQRLRRQLNTRKGSPSGFSLDIWSSFLRAH